MSRVCIALAAVLALVGPGCGANERRAEPTPLPRVVVAGGPQTDIGALPTVAPPPGLRRERHDNGGGGDGGGGTGTGTGTGTGGIVTQTPTATSNGTTNPPVTPTPTTTSTETRGPGE